MKRIVSFFGDRSDAFIQLNERAEEYARQLGLAYQWVPLAPFDQDAVIAHLQQADAGIIDVQPYGEDIFNRIDSRTKLLVRFGVGYENVDLDAASRHGIRIARTTGANTLGVAEMALTMILATKRELILNQRCVQSGMWQKNVSRELIGATLGIVGFGMIGKALAALTKGFNCRILAYDPFVDTQSAKELGVELVGLEDLFAEADAISIHLPYMPQTHLLIGQALLSRMKPTAVLVNTSRGNIVDEDALYAVLSQNKILGAGLDVFGTEPLPLTSPLQKLNNVILTPHVSSQTMESLWRIYAMAIDIASDVLSGKGSVHVLNP